MQRGLSVYIESAYELNQLSVISGLTRNPATSRQRHWIPAFAGMTALTSGWTGSAITKGGEEKDEYDEFF